ncbi:TonB-dependent receptor [Ferrimonas gelatinilytica]|uniref:TonB-dependent receptor n=1 Tax=Ferrimonas gelatinilytica TaxID=1255257 RepID=A0ABP9RRV5_9GAMM
MNKKTYLALQIAAVLGASFTLPAGAEEAPSATSKGRQLEVIQVRSQKRVQNQQEVPIAMTAVSEADIERLGATEVKDIQFATPNFTVTGSDPGIQSFGIRGVADRGRNPGYDLRVGVYVDGVWVGKAAAANQSALDVQTIEILRGPQGTLFGKNTVAGAVNITTIRPSEDFSGYLQAELGNYGHTRFKASVNGGLTDGLSGKLSLSTFDRDGYVDNVYADAPVKEYNDKAERAGRGQLLWQAGERTEVLFTYDHFENSFYFSGGGEAINDPVAPEPYKINVNEATRYDIDGVGGGSVHITHSFDNEFELTSISAYRYEKYGYVDNDEDMTPLKVGTSGITSDGNHFSQELRIASPLYDNFNYVLGLYYLDQETKGGGDAFVNLSWLTGGAVPIESYDMSYRAKVDTEAYAAFGHANWFFTDSLQLTGGVRYTHENKAVNYSIFDPLGVFFANGSTQEDRSVDDWSPKVSLNWFVNEDNMLYVGYSRAFKSGGYNTDFIADLSALEFDDEKVDAYELGMKNTFFDNTLRFNWAIYDAEYQDLQVLAQTPLADRDGSIITITNAGRLTSRGFEMDLQWQALDSLQLWTSYGYTDSKFDEYLGCAQSDNPNGDCSGNVAPEAPKHNFNVGAEFYYPTDSGDFYVNANYFWRDKMFSNANNEPEFENEAFHELSGQIGWKSASGAWNVYAWGKNLTDDTFQTYNTRTFLGADRTVYNAPRMVGITARWNFGSY